MKQSLTSIKSSLKEDALAYELFFKAFSNKTRLHIIQLLREGPLRVMDISEKTGFEQSRISHNLRCLEQCGFVTVTSKGNYRIYALDEELMLPLITLFERHISRYKKRILSCEVAHE